MENATVEKSDESLKNEDQEKNINEAAAETDSSSTLMSPAARKRDDEENGEAEKKETDEEDAAAVAPAAAVEEEKDKDQDEEKDKDKDNEEEEKNEESIEEKSPEDIADDDRYDLDNAMEDVDKFLSSHSANDTDTDSKTDDVSIENHKFIEIFLNLFEVKIINYSLIESGEGKSKCGQQPDEDASFLEALSRVSKLSALVDKHKTADKFGPISNRVGSMHQRAMQMLEEEFRLLMDQFVPSNAETETPKSENTEDQESSEEKKPEDVGDQSEVVVSNLNNIAKAMFLGGYQTECGQMYMLARRHAIDETLTKIGFEASSIDEVQKMPWEALETAIGKWIETFKHCATVLFEKESKLAESVFTGIPTASDKLIGNLTRGVMIHIMNFAGAVSISKRAGEKLFKFLDMFESLRDNGHAIEKIFGENEIKTEIATARTRLGEAIITIFCDLENSIMSDMGKNVVPGGAVHPLTRYTMNYLKLACEYKDTLEQVFKDHLKIERADSNNQSQFQSSSGAMLENQSPFSVQLMKVMDLLDTNLEGKAKLYRDVSLSSIFMMNNGRYILQKVKGSAEINQLLGDNWRRKKSSELRSYHKNYQRETWNKVLGCLRDDHGLTVNGKVVKPELKERFKNFNVMFDEIHKTQSTWVVSDEQLQSELRVSISAVMIPAYRSFLGRFSQYMTPGRQTEKYIKYQAEDIETYIDELFDGNAAVVGKKKT